MKMERLINKKLEFSLFLFQINDHFSRHEYGITWTAMPLQRIYSSITQPNKTKFQELVLMKDEETP